ncbi:MAG: ArsR/SmtB family transcription factor [Candidatus Thorarchaeota archaeon]
MTARTSKHIEADLDQLDAQNIARLFSALNDESRVRIVHLLMQEKRIFVSEIAERTGQHISSVSHHLRILKDLGFVKHERQGKKVYHMLDDDCIRDIMERAKEHVAGK